MAIMHTRRRPIGSKGLLLLLLTSLAASAQTAQDHSPVPKTPESLSSPVQNNDDASDDLENCRVHRVTSLPGSHQFASDYIETLATDPDPAANDTDVIWALTADLSNALQPWEQALYISKSVDGGATWTQVARLDSRYFDAKIGEGIRNGLSVAPGGAYFVVTTQRGAFQVTPQPGNSQPLVRVINGPRVPDTPPKIPIAKKAGDPVRANVVEMTSDGKRLILGYGYFDRDPKMFTYHRGDDGSWVQDGPLPPIPTEMDLLSMQFDEARRADPRFLYVGTGDQVFLLNLKTMKWSRVDGVGPDSAIHGMSVVGGLHLAACWGIYYPTGPGQVRRVTDAHFLIHPTSDEAGSNLRAYSIDVDPARPNREVVTSLTGVYVTQDGGQTWRRINQLPQKEFRTAHFGSDGTILVSGIAGTFLINPFSDACAPHLKLRKK